MRDFTTRTVWPLSVGLVFSLAVACARETPRSDVDPARLVAWIENGDAPVLLDVRSAGEFARGHVPGAVNIPHDQLASRAEELAHARDRDVVVYCERGGRAAKASATLRGAGFSSIKQLTGDMAAWRKAELPVE